MTFYSIVSRECSINLMIKSGSLSLGISIPCYDKTDEQWIALLNKEIIPGHIHYIDPNSRTLSWKESNGDLSSDISWSSDGHLNFITYTPKYGFTQSVIIKSTDAHRVLKMIVDAVLEGRSNYDDML